MDAHKLCKYFSINEPSLSLQTSAIIRMFVAISFYLHMLAYMYSKNNKVGFLDKCLSVLNFANY